MLRCSAARARRLAAPPLPAARAGCRRHRTAGRCRGASGAVTRQEMALWGGQGLEQAGTIACGPKDPSLCSQAFREALL